MTSHQTHLPRRTLVAGAAWSVPTIVATSAAPAVAASCPPFDTTVNWGTTSTRWQPNSARTSGTATVTTPGQPTLTMAVTTARTGNMRVDTNPFGQNQINFDLQPAPVGGNPSWNGLALWQDFTGHPAQRANRIAYTLSLIHV